MVELVEMHLKKTTTINRVAVSQRLLNLLALVMCFTKHSLQRMLFFLATHTLGNFINWILLSANLSFLFKVLNCIFFLNHLTGAVETKGGGANY